ncbi:cytochrome P450 6A1 [Fusarium albosuccineum]|uniref:Cytochrome P450 6A1 n=1 Tax=Fusarium albosuccineum TaxID=1237068 RepID=A0A8H4L495_9HYPO|nr:cytochrome P450 6A1 [Fusarium albosuccineum]
MAIVLSSLAALQSRADTLLASLAVLLLLMAVRPLVPRLSPPKSAPQFLKGYRAFNSPSFTNFRADFLRQGKQQSLGNQFSFWYGSNHVVAVSGESARTTYLTSRGLDSLAGFLVLFGSFLNVDGLTNSISRNAMLVYKRCTQDDQMTLNLHHLVTDSNACLKRISSRVVDPVDTMGCLIYQLTHRMAGTHDIANNYELVAIIGAILAGVFNTSISASWNLCHLAKNSTWMSKIRTEVDDAVEKHRNTPTEDLVDIFQRFTLHDWEKSFPSLELAMHETLRFTMSGTIVRKNIGNKDVPVGDTGFFIPKNSLAVYSSADAHMNPDVWTNPLQWDPSRHNEERAEGLQTPHSFLGWGSGNHPCPAMRFAKLNIVVPTVMIIAAFDFEMCDVGGNITKEPLPNLRYDRVGAGRPAEQVHMRFTPRARYDS